MNEPESSLSLPPRDVAADEALYAALLKADRSESLAPLAAGLAHEMNNLLTTILGSLTLAKNPDNEILLADAEAACVAARELTRRMGALGPGGDGARSLTSARELLAEAGKIAASGSSVEIAIEASETLDPLRVDRVQMVQAFQNLVRNAVEAMSPPPYRPRVQLRAANVTLPDGRIDGLAAGDYVEFEVRDNGNGIPPENLEKIWDPFFTTRKHGSGLGLPTAVSIVRRHGGQIGVDSSVGVGTVFTIFIPRAASPDRIQARPASSQRFRTGRILVMDHDDKIRKVTAGMLQKLEYKADLARDGEEAVSLYKRYFDVGRAYDAVILDLTVIGAMGGEEAFALLRRLDPEVRAIASNGETGEAAGRRCLEQGFSGWLPRPYRLADLGKVLGTVIPSR